MKAARRRFVVSTLLALVTAIPAAWSTDAAPASDAMHGQRMQVLQRIVLMRHGMRSPTKAPDALAAYASAPWPAWPVEPGQLTPHGIDALHSLGRRMAADFAEAGLPHDACRGDVQVIADTTPRNRASARALLDGMAPSCVAAYRAFPAGSGDPLLHGVRAGDDDDKVTIDAAAIGPEVKERLAQLQQVLMGCHDEACLAKAKAAGKLVLLGDDPVKALKTAGSLAENIMLAYVQGMPEASFGWGRLDAAGVAQIITLHNTSFQLAHATPDASRSRGGNMLAHITATLVAAAGQKPSVSSLAPAGTRVLVVIGHDTDLATEAGLLGLDWHDATNADDYPPGGALIYDLVQTPSGKAVRLSVALPTLGALRSGDMAPRNALATKALVQPACGGKTLCPVAQFAALATRAVGNAVTATAGDEPLAK